MKLPKLTFFFLLALLTIFGSCNKDDSNEDPENNIKAQNQKPTGTSARDLLSSAKFEALTIELVYSEGFEPEEQSLSNLRTFLENRLNKPDGITFVENEILPQENAPYDSAEIRAIENANRTLFTQDGNIRVYIYFANGGSSNDKDQRFTLGTAYLNTSMVVYEKTIQDIVKKAPFQFNKVDLESTTMQHEFGHILGLVNLQNDDIHKNSDIVHEDPDNTKHCVVENCLMYFQSSGTTIPKMESFFRNQNARSIKAVNSLDPLCIADLQAKGGK